MVFPEAMTSLDDYRRFKAAVKVPILANLTEFGSTPFFTTDELRDAGVDIALYCCGAYRAMNKAALHFYETVRREGTQKNIVDTLQTRAELYDFMGYHASIGRASGRERGGHYGWIPGVADQIKKKK